MITSIARQEGAVGLFRGLGPTVITNAPYSAFYYLFYTSLKERLQQVRKHAGYLLALRLTRMQIFDPSSSRWQSWLSCLPAAAGTDAADVRK